jgi:hypothetical protein
MAIPEEESIIKDLMNDRRDETCLSQSFDARDGMWLEEDGECMDNVRDGTSTIPHAGRGQTFANRKSPKGSLLATAPISLIHVHGQIPNARFQNGNRTRVPFFTNLNFKEQHASLDDNELHHPIAHGMAHENAFSINWLGQCLP